MPEPIDFVITWVDGDDPQWIKKKEDVLQKISDKSRIDFRIRRFRNWHNLLYLFRGIAKYASWVNHIYLVTPNQFPDWLNTNNSRVTVINQDDSFDDKSVLPTFNNCAVELLLHKIPGLSEQFVYLNDDMFILDKTRETDFFRNNLPRITAAMSPLFPRYSSDGKITTYGIDTHKLSIVARHFRKKEILKKNWMKFFYPGNGREILKTICCLPFRGIPGFNEMHIAYSYLKSIFEKVWEAEPKALEDTLKIRFRGEFCHNHHAMRYWQMASGTFSVRNRSFSKMYDILYRGCEDNAILSIERGHTKMICINDSLAVDEDFELIKNRINAAFEKKFPDKCEFEK